MKNSCFTNRDVSLAYQVRTGRGMLTSDGIALLIVTACCCSVARMLLSWLVLNLTRMRLPGSDGRIGRDSVRHKTVKRIYVSHKTASPISVRHKTVKAIPVRHKLVKPRPLVVSTLNHSFYQT